MIHILSVAAWVLLLIAPAAAQSTNVQYCARLYPESYTGRESCINREYAAGQRVNSRRLMIDSQIWSHCSNLYPESWTSMESCVAREEEAKYRISRGLR